MAYVLTMFAAGSYAAFSVLMYILRLFFAQSPVTAYLDETVVQNQEHLRAMDNAQIATVSKLSSADQVLMLFSQMPLTQARAAKRRYWKNADAFVYAELYKQLGYSTEQAQTIMRVQERMPGYFQKKVLARMCS